MLHSIFHIYPSIKSLCKFAKTSCFINISRFLHKHPSNEDFLLQQFLHLQERPDKINLLPLLAQRMLFIRIFLFFLKSIYSKLNLFSCPSYLRPIAACNHSNVSVEDGIPTQLAQITFVPYTCTLTISSPHFLSQQYIQMSYYISTSFYKLIPYPYTEKHDTIFRQ